MREMGTGLDWFDRCNLAGCMCCLRTNECNKDRDINSVCVVKAKVGTQRASVCLFDGAACACSPASLD